MIRSVTVHARGTSKLDHAEDAVLTVEYRPENVVEIKLDADGRVELIAILEKLTPGDHEHLMTPSWGGYPDQLTEEFPNSDLVSVHKVTIQWVDEDGDGV